MAQDQHVFERNLILVGQYSYPAGYSKFTGGGLRELGQT